MWHYMAMAQYWGTSLRPSIWRGWKTANVTPYGRWKSFGKICGLTGIKMLGKICWFTQFNILNTLAQHRRAPAPARIWHVVLGKKRIPFLHSQFQFNHCWWRYPSSNPGRQWTKCLCVRLYVLCSKKHWWSNCGLVHIISVYVCCLNV